MDITTSTWTRTGRKTVPTALCDCSGNAFVFSNYCADGARSEGNAERLTVDTRTVLHSLLWKHYEMKQILSHT